MSRLLFLRILCAAAAAREPDTAGLAREVHRLGWIGFSSAGEARDWDLHVTRPDGTGRRKLTNTREYNETGVRFSPDGKRILYYRQPVNEPVDNNTYGTYELVIADADGTNAKSLGRNSPGLPGGPIRNRSPHSHPAASGSWMSPRRIVFSAHCRDEGDGGARDLPPLPPVPSWGDGRLVERLRSRDASGLLAQVDLVEVGG